MLDHVTLQFYLKNPRNTMPSVGFQDAHSLHYISQLCRALAIGGRVRQLLRILRQVTPGMGPALERSLLGCPCLFCEVSVLFCMGSELCGAWTVCQGLFLVVAGFWPRGQLQHVVFMPKACEER